MEDKSLREIGRRIGQPELRERLSSLFDREEELEAVRRNHLSYLAGELRAQRLVSLAIEVTNACNIPCTHCPVTAQMQRPRGLMDFELFERILRETPSVRYLSINVWGEPTLHPRLLDMLRLAKSGQRKVALLTNGTRLDPPLVGELLDAGLDTLRVSLDGVDEAFERVRQVPYGPVERNLEHLLAERARRRHPLRVELYCVAFDQTEGSLAELQRRFAGRVDRIHLQPLLSFEAQPGPRAPCREPWRGTLFVMWDGRILPCCADPDATLTIGDARGERLEQVFNGAAMEELRAAHLAGQLFGACTTCGERPSDHAGPRFRILEEAGG